MFASFKYKLLHTEPNLPDVITVETFQQHFELNKIFFVYFE